MPTVLVVDDDIALRNLTRTVLKLEGNEVCEASDGLEALGVLSNGPVDLMILDLNMPNMDGRETFRMVRRRGFRGPIVLISGYDVKSAARELGADDALEKPFDPDQLLAHVNRLLEDTR